MKYHAFTLALLLTCSCKTRSTAPEQVAESVYDYGLGFTRQTDQRQLHNELDLILKMLGNTNTSRETGDQIIRDLFYVEDAVIDELRKTAEAEGPHVETAKGLLWLIGDQIDVERVRAEFKERLGQDCPTILRSDLAEAIQATREALHFDEGDFRTVTLLFNRKMDKAYLQVVIGHGPFNSAGEGFMFHHIEGTWRLIWWRHEWIS